MVRSPQTFRGLTRSRTAPARATKPWLARRAARYLGVEALERRITLDSALFAGGLEFLAMGSNPWTGTTGNQSTTSEVRIGLKGSPFAPQLDVTGGLQLNTTAAPNTVAMTMASSLMKMYSATSPQSATTVFRGTHAFNVGSATTATTTTLNPTDAGVSGILIAGSPMTVMQPDLTGGTTVAASGSIPVAGFSIPVPASLPLTLSASGVTVPALTLSSSTGVLIGGENFKLFSTPANSNTAVSASVTYDTVNKAIDIDGSASLSWGTSSGTSMPPATSESTNDVSLTLGDGGTDHGLVFQNGALTSAYATIKSDLDYRGLEFHLTGLTLSYTKGSTAATSDFDVTGNASVGWTGGATDGSEQNLSIDLIGTGLDIQGGKLNSIDATVSGTIHVKKVVTITVPTADPLEINYSSANQTFSITGAAGVSVGSGTTPAVSFTAQLGSAATTTTPATAGLVISAGTVQSFDVALSGNFSVGGLDVAVTDLGLSYDKSGNIDVDGSAMFSWGKEDKTDTSEATNEVDITLGDLATGGTDHGIVFQNGTFTSFHGTITSDLMYRGLTFRLEGLTVTYASSEFTLSGSASLEWAAGSNDTSTSAETPREVQNNTVAVTLGDATANTPGLVIQNGVLTSLDASITGSITIKDELTLSANGLTLIYGISKSGPSFEIYGDAGLTVGSGSMIESVDVTLGSSTQPGLVITEGGLASFDVTINGSFNLGGLSISPDDLTLLYKTLADGDEVYQVSGGLKVDLTDKIKVSSSIDPGTPLTIDATTGTIDLTDGFSLSLSASIEGFILYGSVSYTVPAGGGYEVVTSATLTTPTGIGFQANLDIADGHLKDIGIGLQGSIPVGDTGLTITWIFGSLQNLDTGDPTITAAATIEYGSIDDSTPILEVTGAIQINKEELLISADPNNLPAIYSSGIVSESDHPLGILLEGGALGQFAGSLDLNWSTGVYTVRASGSLLDGMAKIDVAMTLSNGGDLTFSADVSVNVPDAVPVIGGLELASMHLRLQYKKDDPLSDDYVAAWASITGLGSAGFEYTFDGKFKFLDSSAVAELESQGDGSSVPRNVVYRTDTIVVPPNTGSLQYTVSDPLLDANDPAVGIQDSVNYQQTNWVKITDPSGDVYYGTLGDYAQGTNVTNRVYDQHGPVIQSYTPYVDPLASDIPPHLRTARVFSFNNPPGGGVDPGTWTFSLVAAPNSTSATEAEFLVPDILTTHLACQPKPPDFGAHYVTTNGFVWTQTPPKATQTDLDTINVYVPLSVYNNGVDFTVSLYATNTPLNPSDDLTTPGSDPASTAPGSTTRTLGALIEKENFPFKPDQYVTSRDSMLFSDDVPVSSLPTVPDGTTPVYFYLVVDDQINSPQRSDASNPIVPLAPSPQVSAPAAVVVKPLSGFLFVNNSQATMLAGNYITVAPPGMAASQSVTVTAAFGTVHFSGTPAQLLASESTASGLLYEPPATGMPNPGYDTITVTAVNTAKDGHTYATTRLIQIVPPNNVDLGVSQDLYGPGMSENVLASTDGLAVNVTPASEGEVLDFRLQVNAGTTIASTAPVAKGVTVRYAFPPHLVFVSANASEGTYNPTTGIWTVGDLTTGSARLDVRATVAVGSAGDAIVSAAGVVPGKNPDGSPQVDVNPVNNLTSVSLNPVPPVSGLVYLRADSSDPNDPRNPGVPIVSVELLDDFPVGGGGPTVIGSTVTDPNGRYAFTAPFGSGRDEVWIFGSTDPVNPTSKLKVNLTPAAPYWFGATGLQPSDIKGRVMSAHGIAGATLPPSAFTPASGELVYLDLKNDGHWDVGDPTATTDTNGNFRFQGLAPNIYSVREFLGAGRAAVGSASATVTVGNGANVPTVQLSFEDQRTIWGYQFFDANHDGTDDPGDTGGPGWLYELVPLASSNGQYPTFQGAAFATSDAGGMFHFDNLSLTPGNYSVVQSATGTANSTAYFRVNADGTISTLPHGPLGDVGVALGQGWYGGIRFGDAPNPVGTTTANPTDTLAVSRIAPLKAGQEVQFTVTAKAPGGAVDPNYVGTIRLATNDPGGFVDGSYTFQPSDHGAHTFNLKLMTTGVWTVNVEDVNDSNHSAPSNAIVVSTGLASQCVVVVPTAVASGQAFTVALHPVDSAGNAEVNYWGTADISVALAVNGVVVNNDDLPADLRDWIESGAGLPSTHHFTLDDHGTHSFSLQAPTLSPSDISTLTALGVSPTTPLSLVVNVTDPKGLVAVGNVSIAIQPIIPTPTPAPTPTPRPTPARSSFDVTLLAPVSTTGGTPFHVTVTASPLTAGGVSGLHTIHFVSTDPAAVLPPDVTFTPGGSWSGQYEVTLGTAGNQVVTAIDTSDGLVVGGTAVAVQAAPTTSQGRVVETVYEVLLGHPADASAVAGWTAKLDRGVSPGRLTLALTRGTEYTTAEVTDVYRKLLGRSPKPAELRLAVAVLRQGGSVQEVERDVLSGGGYYRLNGSQEAGFLSGLGRDVLGRAFTLGERAKYAAALSRGASRRLVAGAVLNSQASRQALAGRLFNDMLFRNPTPAELTRWTAALKTSEGRSTAVARLVNTAEFRSLAGASGLRATGRTSHTKAAATIYLRPSSSERAPAVKAGSAHPIARFSKRVLGASSR